MPTTVVPVVMVIDTVVVPIVIPVTATSQSPTWTRKTRIDVPVRTIRVPVTNVIVDVAVTDIDVIPNIDIRIVPNAGTITADARTVDNVIPRVVSNVRQIDIRAISSYDRSIYVARQGRWPTRQSRWTSTADNRAIDIAGKRRWAFPAEVWSIRSARQSRRSICVTRQRRWTVCEPR